MTLRRLWTYADQTTRTKRTFSVGRRRGRNAGLFASRKRLSTRRTMRVRFRPEKVQLRFRKGTGPVGSDRAGAGVRITGTRDRISSKPLSDDPSKVQDCLPYT